MARQPTAQMRRNGPYAPLSAHYSRDDAILALDAAENDVAELLFLRSLAYCAGDPRLDGYISDVALKAGVVLRRRKQERVMKAAETLAEVGVYVRESAGYRLRTWSKWNRTNTEIERKRETDRLRKGTPPPDDSDEPPDDSERTPEDFHAEDEWNPHGTEAESLGVASRGRAPAANATQRSTTQRNPPAVQDTDSATQPSNPAAPPPAAVNGHHPERQEAVADEILAARKRAAGRLGQPDLEGWDIDHTSDAETQAARKFQVDRDQAHDRLLVLASVNDTRSPYRLVEPGGWNWAGDQLTDRRRAEAKQRTDAARNAATAAEHAATAETQAGRRRRIAALTEADPDGWASAQVEAAEELEHEGLQPLPPLVAARALDIHERQAAS